MSAKWPEAELPAVSTVAGHDSGGNLLAVAGPATVPAHVGARQ
jgi:hypothetical protein